MPKTNNSVDVVAENLDHALKVLHPANSTSTYEQKLKAIEVIRKIFEVLYQ